MSDEYRTLADRLAGLCGGRVARNSKFVSGEKLTQFKITLHTEDYWISVRPAPGEFVFSADHKRGEGAFVSFGFSLFRRSKCFGATKLQSKLSTKLGFRVFSDPDDLSYDQCPVLERPRIRRAIRLLARADCKDFVLNDAQLYAQMRFVSVAQAGRWIRRLKGLIVSVGEESTRLQQEEERKKGSPTRRYRQPR